VAIDLLGGMVLQRRLPATPGMPEAEHLQRVASRSVIDEVASATEKKPSNAGNASALVVGPDARVFRQECQTLANVLSDSARCV
jgi:hypothetical protein